MGQGRQRSPHMHHRQSFATDQQLFEAGQLQRIVIHHRVEQRRGQPRRGHAVASDGRTQTVRSRNNFWMDGHRSAVKQSAPNFKRRSVESERSRLQKNG